LQKQQALLQCAVTEEENMDLEKTDPSFREEVFSYEVECGKGAAFRDGEITVTKAKASVTLVFEGFENSETYLYWKNLYSPEIDAAKLSKNRKSKITAVCGEVSKTQVYLSSQDQYYMGKKDFLFQLGYSEKARKTITITFAKKGTYLFDELQVVGQPMEDLPEQVAALKRDVLEEVEFSPNAVKGSIRLESAKLLCLSIPFSNGWTAYVNGEKTDLCRVNTMYSGLYLEPGQYQIELKYRTPGLNLGLACAGLGLMLLLLVCCYRRRKIRLSC